MKAVVTGSAGFIGSRLVHALIERGYAVWGIDRQSRSSTPPYEHTTLDLADDTRRSDVRRLAADADIVFHLAGLPGVRGSDPILEQMRWRDNVVATRNLLSVVPGDTPVVATSSSSVYGGLRNGRGSREDDHLSPRGGYARSKVAMERLCDTRRERGGTIAVVRPFTVAGEGQRPNMAFSLWLAALRRGAPIRILGSGSRTRDITDIDHAVEGLVRAGERRVNSTVNLGTGIGHRLIDLAGAMLDITGISGEVVIQPGFSEEVEGTLANTTRCRQLLDFVPRTDLESLLRRQIEAAGRIPVMAAT